MNPVLFFLGIVGVFSLLTMYIIKRFTNKLDIKQAYKNYLKYFFIFNIVGIMFYVLGRYYIDMSNTIYYLTSVPMGVIFMTFCVAIFHDIVSVLLKQTKLTSNRRNMIKKVLDTSAIIGATALSAKAMNNALHVEIQDVNINIKNLKKEYKIAQLSDVHIGGLIDKEFVSSLVKRVNNLEVDLVVITGDLVDMDVHRIQDVLDELKALKSKYGTFFIVGNHEYFHDIELIIKTVKALGIRVLENENVYIGEEGQGFNLAGVYDLFGFRVDKFLPDILKALEGKKDAPTVMLAHQPKHLELINGGVDLVLSGHTHGGQLYPFRFLVSLQQPYVSGLHQHTKDLQIYINKGTGFWGPPMRLGATSEITNITIKPTLIHQKIF